MCSLDDPNVSHGPLGNYYDTLRSNPENARYPIGRAPIRVRLVEYHYRRVAGLEGELPDLVSSDWTLPLCILGSVELCLYLYTWSSETQQQELLTHLIAAHCEEKVCSLVAMGLLQNTIINQSIVVEAFGRGGSYLWWIAYAREINWYGLYQALVVHSLTDKLEGWCHDYPLGRLWQHSFAQGLETAIVTMDHRQYQNLRRLSGTVQPRRRQTLKTAASLDAIDWVRDLVSGEEQWYTNAWREHNDGWEEWHVINQLYHHSTPGSAVQRELLHHPLLELQYHHHLHYRNHFWSSLLNQLRPSQTDYYYYNCILAISHEAEQPPADKLALIGSTAHHYLYQPADCTLQFDPAAQSLESLHRVAMKRKKSAASCRRHE